MIHASDNLGLFIAAGILLNLTPGPDVVYIVSHSLKRGWRAGAVAALGITAGCFVHIIAAGLGLSALVAASSTAFSVLKWVGAAYLIYVGWGMLGLRRQDARLKPASDAMTSMGDVQACVPTSNDRGDLARIFVQGFWTNALNPKVALFFLAFVPQFIAPGTEHKTLAFLWLGLIFNFNGLWVNLAYAALAAKASARFSALQHGMRWLERVAGGLFVAFGLKLALTDPPSIQ